jgi:hypothetical protein
MVKRSMALRVTGLTLTMDGIAANATKAQLATHVRPA